MQKYPTSHCQQYALCSQNYYLTLLHQTQQICKASNLFVSMVNEMGSHTTVHINRFVMFQSRTFQLKIEKFVKREFQDTLEFLFIEV